MRIEEGADIMRLAVNVDRVEFVRLAGLASRERHRNHQPCLFKLNPRKLEQPDELYADKDNARPTGAHSVGGRTGGHLKTCGKLLS